MKKGSELTVQNSAHHALKPWSRALSPSSCTVNTKRGLIVSPKSRNGLRRLCRHAQNILRRLWQSVGGEMKTLKTHRRLPLVPLPMNLTFCIPLFQYVNLL